MRITQWRFTTAEGSVVIVSAVLLSVSLVSTRSLSLVASSRLILPQVFMEQGQLQKALDDFLQALKVQPRDTAGTRAVVFGVAVLNTPL
jgi:Tfp pilus assembly protein PilF